MNEFLFWCTGSSVGRPLMPRKQRVVGSNPTQGSSFLGLLNCVPLPCILPRR